MNHGSNVQTFDPYLSTWPELEQEVLSELPSAAHYDAIVFTTPHTDFEKIDLIKWLGDARPIVLDTVNVVSDHHRGACREVGIVIESIGRGLGL
jgi:UDP-N-acetyl-D-mannosaminuronate dehydrogenase